MYRAPYIEDAPEEVVLVDEAIGEVVDDASLPNSLKLEMPDELNQRLLDAVRKQDEDSVRRLVDDGANLGAKDVRGQTPLHLAVHNNDESMVKFFAEKGIDLEESMMNGRKALYIAAAFGFYDIAALLLSFGASTEAINAENHQTAFYQAVKNGHFETAKLLLQNGADINVRSSTGLTPLFCAVTRGDVSFVEYLLEYGADKTIELEDGRTVEDFAKDNPAINILLLSDQVLQGPSITKSAKTNPERHFTFTPSLPADSIYKEYACHGFDATIVDFFLGDREQRIQVTESMYEILYGQGAEAIMEAAKGPKMRTQEPKLRWYHLPANNMEWVEILIRRIFAEKSSGSVKLDDELKSRLALTSTAGRQYRTVTAQSSSFMRPLCQTVEAKPGSEQSTADHIVLFMPYLHFETIRGYEEMMSHIQIARNTRYARILPRAPPQMPAPKANRNARHSPTDTTTETTESVESHDTAEKKRPKWNNIAHRTEQLRLTFQNLKRQLALEAARKTKAGIEDLEKGKVTNTSSAAEIFLGGTSIEKKGKRADTVDMEISTEGQIKFQPAQIEASPQAKPDIRKDSQGDKIQKGKESHPFSKPDIVIPNQSASITDEGVNPHNNISQTTAASSSTAVNQFPSKEPGGDPDSPNSAATEKAKRGTQSSGTFGVPTRASTFKGKDKLADIPEGRQPRSEEASRGAGTAFEKFPRPEPRTTRVSLSRPDEILIKAYSSPSIPGQMPPLQLRRTLDQYFYTDLSNTHQRDTDQVVLRYTINHRKEPKIFMVDQLWLWVLNDDTVISCYPHRWSTDTHAHGTAPPPPPPALYWPGGMPSQPKPITAPKDKTQSFDISSDAVESPTAPVMNAGRQRRASKGIADDVEFRSKRKRKTDSSHLMKYLMGGSSRVEKKDKIDKAFVAWAADPRQSSGPTSSIEQENKRRRQAFLRDDPLNVHQTILKNLYGLARSPITSASDLAILITSSCVDVFDQYKIPSDFQFFDFFESSIGAVIEKEAQCFKRFTRSLDSDMNSFGIGAEVQLLIEIKDIRDELGILEMVLNDQGKVLADFYHTAGDKELNVSQSHTKVLQRHLDRIRQMDKLAEKTYQALNGLLDLKQKQANVSEALSARKQAEIAAAHAEQGAEHAKQATLQAIETTRQGKTVLLFTVVTIIFLPLSFMAAFFAISIDSFPVNDNGRLPMNYVLKYMLTISAAISIPFILVAFNQDRITRWLRSLKTGSFWWSCIFIVLLILLSVIWTSHLASNIKGALTAALILLALLAGVGKLLYSLFSAVHIKADADSYTTTEASAFS